MNKAKRLRLKRERETSISPENKNVQENQNIDFLIIHNADEKLFFHNIALFQDIMAIVGKNVISFNLRTQNNLQEYIDKSDYVICYRTEYIPEEVLAMKGKMPIGYMIDDNIFYEEGDDFIENSYRSAIRECIKKSDYCLAYSEELTKELVKINPNSFCLGNPPLWKERYERYNITEPTLDYKNDILTIGITSRHHFTEEALKTIAEASQNCNKKIKVIYFSDQPIKINSPDIIFEHHPFVDKNMKEWYDYFHNLKLDLVYVELSDNTLIASKSDLKFRECAYMKMPIVALDPSGKVYCEINNEENGYSLTKKEDVVGVLHYLINHPEEIKPLGENAYTTLMSRNPNEMAERIMSIFKKIAKKKLPVIQVFKPFIRQESINSVIETLKSSWLGTGAKTKRFEEDFKKYLQTTGECVAVMSATDALELTIKLYDITEGDEVITTPITFISTNHAILYNGAIPVFADVSVLTGSILPSSVESKITDKTKAIIIVHLSGYACDMENIERIADKYNLNIIEDCAHASGGYYHNGKHKGKRIGSSDNICCFSFQSVKNLPCGDGGMIVTPTKELAERANHLRWMGIDKDTYSRTTSQGEYLWKYDVPELGIKTNQNDIMSSIGLEQLKYLDADNNRRRQISRFYQEKLATHPKISLPHIDIETSACHFYPIYVNGRDHLLLHLRENNIFCGVHYRRNDKYANYKEQSLPNAEYIETHTLTLPIHLYLTNNDLARIVETINDWQ